MCIHGDIHHSKRRVLMGWLKLQTCKLADGMVMDFLAWVLTNVKIGVLVSHRMRKESVVIRETH